MRFVIRHITLFLTAAAMFMTAGTPAYAQTAAGTRVTNVANAHVRFANGDSLVMKTDTAVVIVESSDRLSSASMKLRKVSSHDRMVLGGSWSYTIVVLNDGASTLRGITVIDSLDTSAVQALTVNRGLLIDNRLVWTIDSLAPGDKDSVVINARMLPTAAVGSSIVNIASATSTETGATPSIDSAIVTVDPPAFHPLPGAMIDKRGPETAVEGDTVEYTIAVSNTGNVAMKNAIMLDSLDQSMRFVSAVPAPSFVDSTSGVVEWSLGQIDTLESRTVRLLVRYVQNLQKDRSVVNLAGVRSDELAWVRDSAITLLQPGGRFSFRLHKSSSVDSVAPGGLFAYTIVLSNDGEVDLADIEIVDTLDVVRMELLYTSPATVEGPVVRRRLSSLPIGGVDSLFIMVRVRPDVAEGTQLVNLVSANAIGINRIMTAEAVTHVRRDFGGSGAKPSLELRKTVSRDTVETGGLVTYTLWFRNNGDVELTNVMVVDTLPTTVEPIVVSGPGRTAGRVVATLPSHLNSLPVGHEDSVVVTVRVRPGVADGIRVKNVASARSDQAGVVHDSASFVIRASASVLACRVTVTATPSVVIGNGRAPSVIRAMVTDSLGIPKPDGTPVVFRSTVGTFSNGLDSIVVPVVGGVAVDSLRTLIVSNSIVTAQASVTVDDGGVCRDSATVDIVFFPGAITGIVVNNGTNLPEEGAVVSVYASSGAFIGSVTTGADGSYLIPVPSTDEYTVRIQTVDNFGMPMNTVTTVPVLVPGVGGEPPVRNLIVLSGKVFYLVSQKPVAASGIKVVLTQLPLGAGQVGDNGFRIGRSMVDSTFTDSTGSYTFSSLPSGNAYEVSVDDLSLRGTVSVTSLEPGKYVTDANIPIVLNPAIEFTKVGPIRAFSNDTVTYRIDVRNTGNYSATNVILRDSLDPTMRFVSAVPAPATVDSVNRLVRWSLGTVDSAAGPSSAWSILVRVRFADTLSNDYRAVNTAGLSSDQTTDTAVYAATDVIQSMLAVTKSARRKIVEVGDQVMYTVGVRNASSDLILRSVVLEDHAPLGFRYLPGTSFRDTVLMPEPVVTRTPGSQILRWMLADSLPAGENISISYRMIVGAGAREGDGVNRAQAFAHEPNGVLVASSLAEERVEIQAGVFTDRGVIVGKVFYDPNNNAFQDAGEMGVKGVELMTEDGTRIVTGDDGKYSIPDIAPGRHVIKVRRHTLPPRTSLHAGNNDFAYDGGSRFVEVTPGGIARADFYLDPAIPDDSLVITQSVARYGSVRLQRFSAPRNVTFIDDERPALMKLTGLNFEVGKAVLRPEAFPVIRQLADIMRENPDERVGIMGHTDGSPIRTVEFPNNRVLSIARAEAVKQALVNVEGIDVLRIETMGFGESRPVAPNDTREGKALNRRVEFSFGPVRDPEAKRMDAAVVVRIPIDYRGDEPVQAIEITDSLATSMTLAEETGRFNGRSIAVRRDGQRIIWTIDSVGKAISGELVYQVRIPRPAKGIELHRSTTTGMRLMAAETVAVALHLTVENRSAVAVRGRAVNYLMPSVLFETAKASLHAGAETALEATAAMLAQDPTLTAVIEGHTDSRPIRTRQFPSNLELSRARAQSVVEVLVTKFGIDRDRLESVGFGEHRPLESNTTSEGRQANRRIELRLVRDDFGTSVIPQGGIDSSRIQSAPVPPGALAPSLLADSKLQQDDRVLVRLVTAWQGGGRRPSHVSVVDSLAPWMKLAVNSIRTHGIDSVSLSATLRALVSPRSDQSSVTFEAQILKPTTVQELLSRPVTVIQNLEPALTVRPGTARATRDGTGR